MSEDVCSQGAWDPGFLIRRNNISRVFRLLIGTVSTCLSLTYRLILILLLMHRIRISGYAVSGYKRHYVELRYVAYLFSLRV